ncbi:hypothetical protein OH77DRAFT_123517 [Trametes cingulata]|nr:hypothetical protein OH77DRAFT_123517 [Trametes cingulata]
MNALIVSSRSTIRRSPRVCTSAPYSLAASPWLLWTSCRRNNAFYAYRDKDLPESVMDDVRHALEVLHGAGLVHGDVRPNILPCPRQDGKNGAMLVNFDWAGEDGQACYPALLNQSREIDWDGVRPGGQIRCAHDLVLLARARFH